MKLFVWANPYDIDYGSAMCFAVAETEEQAREMLMGGNATAWSFGECEDEDLSRPSPTRSWITLAGPTRVVDLPCAEWHRWEE